MNTLAVHAGGIGDFVLACPALAELAKAGPATIAGIPERAQLAVAGGIAERVVSLDDIQWHTLFSEPSFALRDFLSEFKRIHVWMNDSDGALRRGLSRAGCTSAAIHPGLPPENWLGHAADYYLSTAGGAGPARPELRIAPEGDSGIVIHPGSGGARKNWPLENFIALADVLGGAEWMAGPAELDWGIEPPEPRIAPMPLVRAAAMLAGARLYIGNDSGMTHLAAAVGCPTLAIFQASEPARWGPKGEGVRIIGGMDSPPGLDEAIAAARTLISDTA